MGGGANSWVKEGRQGGGLIGDSLAQKFCDLVTMDNASGAAKCVKSCQFTKEVSWFIPIIQTNTYGSKLCLDNVLVA